MTSSASAAFGALASASPRGAELAETVFCHHCGLLVPPGLVHVGEPEQFCCDGCRRVYFLLHECGLEGYYAYREETGAEPLPVQSSGRDYEEFDAETFHALYARQDAEGIVGIDLYLEGVHCAACVWLVEKLPVLLPGVREARLDFLRRVLHVAWVPAEVPLSHVARYLDALGYPPHPYRGSDDVSRRRKEERALLMRVGVAGAVAGNVMLMAFALYSGLFEGMAPEFHAFFRWGSLLISAPAVLWCGSIFFRGAMAAVRTRTPHMDLPVSIGILAGFAWGAIGTLLGKGEIYFDSVTMLIFVLLVGRWLQHRQQRFAFEAAELLNTLTPSTARIWEEGAVRQVPAERVSEGALVEVRSGETLPVDGVVERGSSALDTAVLTGEALPQEVERGAAVYAGCTNLTAALYVRCTRAGAETRVGQLMRSVEEAARRRAPLVRLADRIAGYLVVVALVLAALTFIGWSFVGWERAVDNAVALLIVACPCGLGLATPLVVSAALGRAARRGLLIKGGDVLEKLAHPGTFVFDKTGTLTLGKVRLVGFAGDERLKPAVFALETHSAHPVARALVEGLGSEGSQECTVEDVSEIPGGGMSGRVGGMRLLVGSERLIRSEGADVPTWAEDEIARSLKRGLSPVLVALEGRVAAVGSLGDELRSDAAVSLLSLRAMGHRLVVLSGDHPEAVERTARQLEKAAGRPLFEAVLGGRTPEQKLAYVQAAKEPTFMVGDGVNDAAALSAATVGIAVQGGAEASLLAADVFARRSGVDPVVELAHGARRALRVLRRGLGMSLLYNSAGISLAVAGLISPLLAAVLMPVSSLSVIGNAYRSKTFGGEP